MKRQLSQPGFSKAQLVAFIAIFAIIGGYFLYRSFAASLPTVYVAQSAAGASDGSSCTNARAVSFFNTAANWGAGSTQIGPGTTVHLCGTINTTLTAQADGASGSPITILFEPGAKLSQAVCPDTTGCLNLNNRSYITVDGGSNGILENTANGTNLANHASSIGIDADPCNNCTVENLTIQNIYVHAGTGSEIAVHATRAITFSGSNWTIQNNTCHDVDLCFDEGLTSGDTNIHVTGNTLYNFNNGWNPGGLQGDSVGNLYFDHNHAYNMMSWDASDDAYHHEAIHCYTVPGSIHINNFYIYDNTFDGDPGVNSTTWIFLEGNGNACNDNTSNIWFFNNKLVEQTNHVTDSIVSISNGKVYEANNWYQGPGSPAGSSSTGNSCASTVANVTLVNNVIGDCDYLIGGPSTGVTQLDYNAYTACTYSQCFTQDNYVGSNFADYQAAGYEPHSTANIAASIGSINTAGVGENMTATCNTISDSAVATACKKDINGNSRPTTGAWDIGPAQAIQTANVWVSTTGNDATCTRGDSAKPCATLPKALSLASAGDTISVSDGNYTSGCTISSTFTSDVTVTGSANAKFICAPLSFTGASHIVIDGPSIEQLYTDSTSSHLTFQNLSVTCSDSAPFTLYPPDNLCDASATISGTPNITFTNVSIGPTYDASSCNASQGNDTSKFLGKTTVTATNITFHDARTPNDAECGTSQHTENLMIADVGSQNGGSVNINRCRFTNGANSGKATSGAPDGTGPNTGELFFDGQDSWSGDGKNGVSNMTFQNCIFDGAGSHGLHADGFAALTNSLFENNTWAITSDFDYSGTFTSLTVRNNIGNDGLCINSNSGGGGIYKNNVFYDPENSSAADNCGDASNIGIGSGSVNAIFMDYPNNLQLSVNSVALNHGDSTAGHYPATDYLGVLRPQGAAVDAGAYEYTLASGTIPGDLNTDGSVNITDLSILLSHYGQSGQSLSTGDCNGDGSVTITDLSILLSHYGT